MNKNSVVQKCPLCSQTAYDFIREFPDGVTVGQCTSCGTIYTPLRHPFPDSLFSTNEIQRLVIEFEPVLKGRKNYYRIHNFKGYLRILSKFQKGKNLLDVGCAHGIFPYTAQQNGYVVAGVETSVSFAQFAQDFFKLRIFKGKLEDVDLANEKWNIVTFTDSMEYFPEPISAIEKLKGHFSEDAILFIKVPNGSFFSFRWKLAKLTGIKSIGESAFTPSMRVMHYSQASLKLLIEKAGLEVLQCGPSFPTDAPAWHKLTGYYLVTTSPWWIDTRRKLFRRLGFIIAKVANFISPSLNYFSSSIYVVAKKKSA